MCKWTVLVNGLQHDGNGVNIADERRYTDIKPIHGVSMLFSSAAPCAPQALSMKPLCDIDSMLVSWAYTNLAQSYYLTAIGLDGDVQNCSSTTENCTLSRLHCGQSYTLSVVASDGNCTSPASQALTFLTSETIISLTQFLLKDRLYKKVIRQAWGRLQLFSVLHLIPCSEKRQHESTHFRILTS